MPETGRRRLTGDARRSAILDAAMAVIAADGYEGATMRTIATRAGVTPPVVYDHFASKALLHTALLDRESDAFFGAVSSGDERPPLEAVVIRAIGFVDEYPHAGELLFGPPPPERDLAAAHTAFLGRFARIVSQSPDLAKAKEGLVACEMVTAALVGLLGWRSRHLRAPRSRVVVDTATKILHQGLRALR